ncbi:MAG: FAD-binding protein [Bacteroidota bacterium]
MIVRKGPRKWRNIHTTFEANLEEMMDLDNSSPSGRLSGMEFFKQAAKDIDALIQEAKAKGKKIRALGSAWALTDIHLTDKWMLNTKLLNQIFDLSDRNFHDSYPVEKRPYILLAQCGVSVAELNKRLETNEQGIKRALRTAGIGAGQTIVGAVSGNTHGAAVNFGAMPEFVRGIQLVNGTGQSIWIERESEPIVNDRFITNLDAKLIRNDDIFNSALVSFGAYGVITALAIETEPIYHIKFPPMQDISFTNLKQKLNNMDYNDPSNLHHFEFIFNPYDEEEQAVLVIGTKEDYIPGHVGPDPLWIITDEQGYAPGDKTPPFLLRLPFLSAAWKSKFQYKEYKKNSILSDVRGSSGQLYTATITYLEGYSESAIAVGIEDAARMIEIIVEVVKEQKLPSICQARVVKASRATFGFTYLGSRSVVFEFALVNDGKFAQFENKLVSKLKQESIKYTFHWSKNSGISKERLFDMYGVERVQKWKAARRSLFNNDKELMAVFDNDHIKRAELDVDSGVA